SPLGARRVYFPNEGWQDGVTRALREVKLVVVRVGFRSDFDLKGFGDSFKWEIEQAVRMVSPRRLVIVFDHKATYETFCTSQAELFPKPFPPYRGTGRDTGRLLVGYLHFDNDGTPHFRQIPSPHILGLMARIVPFGRIFFPFLRIAWQIRRADATAAKAA